MNQRKASSILDRILFILIPTLAWGGCAKVPPQSVVLSRTVGPRLVDLPTT